MPQRVNSSHATSQREGRKASRVKVKKESNIHQPKNIVTFAKHSKRESMETDQETTATAADVMPTVQWSYPATYMKKVKRSAKAHK
mmetsp:Transcript_21725/g.29147  ORF Transcript_21725/g.29147 Transcript_21725/m.29147 type:complete len:86 (+) Transcript_21725:929-1186(+)